QPDPRSSEPEITSASVIRLRAFGPTPEGDGGGPQIVGELLTGSGRWSSTRSGETRDGSPKTAVTGHEILWRVRQRMQPPCPRRLRPRPFLDPLHPGCALRLSGRSSDNAPSRAGSDSLRVRGR